MIEIILSDRVYVFSVVLCVIALLTRKDLAIYAAIISVIGSLVWYENLPNESTYAAFCVLNLGLVIIAGTYNHIQNTLLSKVVALLGSLACVLNAIQIVDVTAVSGYISTGLVVALITSLMVIDGRKGMFIGIYNDFRASYMRRVHYYSRTNNDKNS